MPLLKSCRPKSCNSNINTKGCLCLNPCVRLTNFLTELDNINYLIQKSKKGKQVIERRTKYQILFKEKENSKQKYHKNLISRKGYLKSMGHEL